MISHLYTGRRLLLCLCTLVIGLSSCSHFHSKQKSVKEENKSLAQALESIDQGALATWDGWSPAWKMADILKVWQPKGEPLPDRLGSQALLSYSFPLTHQSQPLQVLADSLGKVALLRLEDAVLTQSASELEQLWGAPAAKKILPQDHRFAPAQLWVFPQRGISLFVMDAQKRGRLCLSAIALYVPMSLEIYLSDLEGDERIRYSED